MTIRRRIIQVADLDEENVDKSWAFLPEGECNYCDGDNGGVTHTGSPVCRSGGIAAGGTRSHCTCDACY